MKNRKRLLAIGLLAVLLFTCFTGCAGSKEQAKKLEGVWVLSTEVGESLKQTLLESIGMSEVEIPLMEHLSFSYDIFHAFNADGTFRLAVDTDSMKTGVKQFYRDVFDTLYDNIPVLEEAYGISFNGATREEFWQLYAEAQDMASYEEMIEYFAANCFDYTVLSKDISYGSYTVKGKRIIMEDRIGDRSGEVDFTLAGNSLTLFFGDGPETYIKK